MNEKLLGKLREHMNCSYFSEILEKIISVCGKLCSQYLAISDLKTSVFCFSNQLQNAVGFGKISSVMHRLIILILNHPS